MKFERDEEYNKERLRLFEDLSPKSYRAYYAKLMDLRAQLDPKAAVGGLWDEIGELIFSFLRANGLETHSRVLDVGCGSLRIGRYLVSFLEPGHYTGIDLSTGILGAGSAVLDEEGLSDRKVRLLANQDLRFLEFQAQEFDFILAQSVLTHMPADDINECMSHIGRVMAPEGRFLATVFLGDKPEYVPEYEVFRYPLVYFTELCRSHGLICQIDESFRHPRGQTMLTIAAQRVKA